MRWWWGSVGVRQANRDHQGQTGHKQPVSSGQQVKYGMLFRSPEKQGI